MVETAKLRSQRVSDALQRLMDLFISAYALIKKRKRSGGSVQGLLLAMSLFLEGNLDVAIFDEFLREQLRRRLNEEGSDAVWYEFLSRLDNPRIRRIITITEKCDSLKSLFTRMERGTIGGIGNESRGLIEWKLVELGLRLRPKMTKAEIESIFGSHT